MIDQVQKVGLVCERMQADFACWDGSWKRFPYHWWLGYTAFLYEWRVSDPKLIHRLREQLPAEHNEALPDTMFIHPDSGVDADLHSADETVSFAKYEKQLMSQPDQLDNDSENKPGLWGPGYEYRNSGISLEASMKLTHGQLRKELSYRWWTLLRFFEHRTLPPHLIEFWRGGIEALEDWCVLTRADAEWLRVFIDKGVSDDDVFD